MIFLSYGMPKSASSFAFQIAQRLAVSAWPQVALKARLPSPLDEMFYIEDAVHHIETLLAHIPEDEIYVVKTHQGYDERLDALFRSGRVIGSVTYRDPYDVVVSLLDAARRERARPAGEQREVFARISSVEDALDPDPDAGGVVRFMRLTEPWLAASRRVPNLVSVGYEELRGAPVRVAERFARLMGPRVKAEPAKVVSHFLEDRSRIWEYNQGRSGRGYREIRIPPEHPTRREMDRFKQTWLTPGQVPVAGE